MEDEALIPLSALQHYLYCPRQCALIHLEQQWAENRYTAEGRLLHQRVDQPRSEKRSGVRSVSALPLVALQLGIAGIADAVEFHTTADGERLLPVEYKRGKPKKHRADEVQLCAQALCLEEMFGQQVAEGALYYDSNRRRQSVIFDDDLRQLTLRTIAATRAMFDSCATPHASYEARRCDACSLLEICQPKWLARGQGVARWLQGQWKE